MRTKRIFLIIISVVVIVGMQAGIQAHLDHRLYALQNNTEILLADAISDLKKNRIILVGEHHANQNHHFAQLNVIQSLNEAGVRVAPAKPVVASYLLTTANAASRVGLCVASNSTQLTVFPSVVAV